MESRPFNGEPCTDTDPITYAGTAWAVLGLASTVGQ